MTAALNIGTSDLISPIFARLPEAHGGSGEPYGLEWHSLEEAMAACSETAIGLELVRLRDGERLATLTHAGWLIDAAALADEGDDPRESGVIAIDEVPGVDT